MTDPEIPDTIDLSNVTFRDAILNMKLPPARDDHGNRDIIRATLRRIQAVHLRVNLGWSYDRIAAHLGYSDRSTCRKSILNGLRQVQAEDLVEMRAIENARYDELHTTYWPLAHGLNPTTGERDRDPDPYAAKLVLDISDRRRKMNGLDAPTQVTISSGAAAELADALTEFRETILGEWEEADDPDPGTGTPPALEG